MTSEREYFEAIRKGDVGALREAVAARPELLGTTTTADYKPEGPLGCTGLHAAIHAGQTEVARALIEAGVPLDARSADGRSALHDSIEFGHGSITEMLLAAGAELDICSAAILGRLERVRELLDRDPGLVDDRSTGLSPLGWASFGNQVATATELIDRGARMDDGELLCAASVGHVEVGRLLLDRGADPEEIHPEPGCNALHAAAAMRYACDSTRFLRMLFERGVDANATTTKGATAVDLAEAAARRQEHAPADSPENRRKRFDLVLAVLREHGGRPGGTGAPAG